MNVVKTTKDQQLKKFYKSAGELLENNEKYNNNCKTNKEIVIKKDQATIDENMS